MRTVSNFLLGAVLTILSLNAIISNNLPGQLSSMPTTYSFEPGDAAAENNIETSAVKMTRPFATDLVHRNNDQIVCSERKNGAVLTRLCEDTSDGPSMDFTKRLDQFVMEPLQKRHIDERVINTGSISVRNAVYTLNRWDDLAVVK